jgi:hypothetical protein
MGTEIADIERAALANNPSWYLVQRISASACFQNSPRLRELLLYICERALLNRPDDLREQLIGCRVFLRKPDYNPGEDNIVRVEVRRLRKRLEDYFNSEGLDEPVIVSVPKGSYVPVFQPRGHVPAEAAPVPPANVEPSPATVAVPLAPRKYWYRLVAVVAVATALVSVGFWAGRRKAGTAASVLAPDWSPLWPTLINRNQQTLIVCADSTLVMAQTLTRNSVTLDDYAAHRYSAGGVTLGEDTKRIFGLLQGWTWTDLADVRLVDRLHRVNAGSWDRISIRTARTVQIHDFTSGNVVILGSTQSNPWNTLFEQQLNFLIDWDERTRTASVRNKAPLAGEESSYPPPPPPPGGGGGGVPQPRRI